MKLSEIPILEKKLNRANELKDMIELYDRRIIAMDGYFESIKDTERYIDICIDCGPSDPRIEMCGIQVTDQLRNSIMNILMNGRARYLTELEEL